MRHAWVAPQIARGAFLLQTVPVRPASREYLVDLCDRRDLDSEACKMSRSCLLVADCRGHACLFRYHPNCVDTYVHHLQHNRAAHSNLDAKAMFAEPTKRPCYFRCGHGIAVPLLAKSTSNHLRRITPQDRKSGRVVYSIAAHEKT